MPKYIDIKNTKALSCPWTYIDTIVPDFTSSMYDYWLTKPGAITFAPFKINFNAPLSAINLGYIVGYEWTVFNVGIIKPYTNIKCF